MDNNLEGTRLPRFLLRWFVNGLGLWASARLLEGIDYSGSLGVIAMAALIFSLINAVIRPLIIIFALPAIILTMGLFMLVVNGLMIYLTSLIYPALEISSFTSAVLAALIVGVVNYILSMFIDDSGSHAPKPKDDGVIDIDA